MSTSTRVFSLNILLSFLAEPKTFEWKEMWESFRVSKIKKFGIEKARMY